MKKTTVVVVVDKGSVSQVFADGPGIEVLVLDKDVEGTPRSEQILDSECEPVLCDRFEVQECPLTIAEAQTCLDMSKNGGLISMEAALEVVKDVVGPHVPGVELLELMLCIQHNAAKADVARTIGITAVIDLVDDLDSRDKIPKAQVRDRLVKHLPERVTPGT